jgi:hypothetical protein
MSFLVFIGSLVGSSSAVPGDLLYGLKRFSETTKLALAGELDKASLHLEVADERLKEAKVIAARNDTEAAKEVIKEYGKQIGSVNNEISKARHEEELIPLLEKVTEDTSKHISILENLHGKYPKIEEEIEESLNISIESHRRAEEELKVKIKENKRRKG